MRPGRNRATNWAWALVSAPMLIVSCLPATGQKGDQAGEGGSSILASMDGIHADDRNRPGMKYELKCHKDGAQGVAVVGTVESSETDLRVRFSGDKIVDAAKCALEVTNDTLKGNASFEWTGFQNGKEVEGLMYASDEAVLSADRKLNIKLWILYKEKSKAPAFSADLAIELELGDQEQIPANIVGQLDCDAANIDSSKVRIGGGKVVIDERPRGKVSFSDLDISEWENKACHKLTLLVDNTSRWQVDLSGFKFVNPDTKVVSQFPGNGKNAYKLARVIGSSSSDVTPNLDLQGPCLNFDVASRNCLDRRSVKLVEALPRQFAVALVKGRRGDAKSGGSVSYIVGMNPNGFGALEGNKLTVDMLNNARGRYSWYNADLAATMFKDPFDAAWLAGDKYEGSRVKVSTLEDVTVHHIESVWVHGFHSQTVEQMASRASARWMAFVTASKSGQVDVSFVVTGGSMYFNSPQAPMQTSDGKLRYVDMPAIVEDFAKGFGSPLRWAAYAFATGSGAMKPSECSADRAFYQRDMSLKHQGELKSGTPIAELDNCAIIPSVFLWNKDNVAQWKFASELFVWDWAKF